MSKFLKAFGIVMLALLLAIACDSPQNAGGTTPPQEVK